MPSDMPYLIIVPQVQVVYDSIVQSRPKTEWAIDLEVMRARGKIVLVKSKSLVKKKSILNIFRKFKLDFFVGKTSQISLLVGYNHLVYIYS